MRVQRRKLLVTAVPRSGTKYTAKVLNAVGLRVGHEYVDEDGTVSYLFASNAPGHAISISPNERRVHVRCGRRRDYAFEHVWHQVRHPLAVLSSLRYVNVRWQDMLDGVGVDVRGLGRTHRALLMWCEWNLLIEEQAPSLRYRIEEIDTVWPAMLSALGLPSVPLPNVPKDTHTELRWTTPFGVLDEKARPVPMQVRREFVRKTPPLDWKTLERVYPAEALRARRLAERYGYSE